MLTLTSEMNGLVLSLVEIDYTQVNAAMAKLGEVDGELYDELESAVNGTIGQAALNGFLVGWRCAKQPELLIFEPPSE